MKLRSIISTVAATVAIGAMATDYTASKTFARLPVSGAPASAIIALPFSGCGEANMEIYVTNLVMTTNLEAGDTLLFKDDAGWKAWEIDSSGNWVGVTTSTKKGGVMVTPNASEFKITCGKACWLNRQTPANTFYLYGQVNAFKTNVTVAAGTSSGPTYTIVGCPWEVDSFDIQDIKNAADGDTVIVMDSNGTGRVEYKYSEANTRWEKETSTPATGTFPGFTPGTSSWGPLSGSDGIVPAGLGFMYGRKATSPLTIQWPQ